MKKLSLLLLTLCLSLATWAQTNSTAGLAYTLNPYAYDLAIKSWDPATRMLTVTFKLNAVPNLDGDGYNSVTDGEPNGIQIYAVNPRTGEEFRIGGPGRADIQKGTQDGVYEYTMNLSAGTTVGGNAATKQLPLDEPLTWKVRVKGRNKGSGFTAPRHVTARPADFKRPRYVLGVSIGKNPLSPNFGKMFTTELEDGSSSSSTSSTWYWLYNALYDANYKESHRRMPAVLEFTPQLKFKGVHKKYIDDGASNSHFSLQKYSEPHRVRVSEDGRIFVSSYHQGAGAAVKEYLGNNTFRTVIKFDASINNDNQNSTEYPTNSKYNRRAVDFDVKGSGDDLNILVAWVKPKGSPATGNNKQWNTSIEIYEYKVGKEYDIDQTNGGTLVARYIESNPSNHLCGFLFQSYYATGYCAQRALIGVGYGSGNNDIWLKVDPGVNFGESVPQARIMYFNKQKGLAPQKVSELAVGERFEVVAYDGMPAGEFYGGGSFIVKDNKLYTYVAISASNSAGKLRIYTINNDGSLSKDTDISLNVSAPWANGFAIDYANNLYMVSEWLGDIKTISLPYSGTIETPAPTNSTFTIAKPVPNILATDLRLEINNANEYTFSFNTNTKPEEAEIRFYSSYDAMKNSLNVVNADNYNGTNANKPVCFYRIPSDRLKQGRVEVTLGGVGGTVDANGEITNSRIPAGELYWSVYVKTRESSAFAPIYEQSTTGEDAHNRLHATVNNYPETDGFGHIYAVNYYTEFDARNGLMEYSFNPNGNSIDDQNNIKNPNRYKLVKNYLNPSGNKPKFTNQRRLAVAPDGKVYIADCGQSYPFDADADRPWMFKGGGVFVWNPNTQTGNEIQISLFSTKDQYSTATAVDIYNHNGQLKLYATNTYGEFDNHYNKGNLWKGKEYTEANQADVNIYGWNGFKEFNLGTPNNILLEETTGTVLHSLGMGDGNGHISLVAMEKGVWMAQHRLNDVQYSIDLFKANNSSKPALPDNTENYILSFVPYGSNTRTWQSCTSRGITYSGSTYSQAGASELTQLPTSPVQACPGAGLAYRKTNGKEFLYIVNHQGNIVELQITSWSGTTPSVKYIKTYPGSGRKASFQNTGRMQGIINTMCFDYAGNLITTSGTVYLGGSTDNLDIIVYTMPYDRVNAREIQAPNSCRMIPERLAYLDMSAREMELIINNHKDHDGCAIELFRPLQAGMFNTICLPFELDFANLPNEHPFKDAEVRAFTGATLEDVGGEKVLSLVFSDITKGEQKVMGANTPYLLQPVADIVGSVRFDYPIKLTSIYGNSVGQDYDNDKINDITFQGVIPITSLEAIYSTDGTNTPLTLLLVADNRLAALTSNSDMRGFRAYFQLAKPLPPGTAAKIVGKKPVTTNTTIVVDGKKVNVEKFLREGRVYIRVGETLYNMSGEIIER